MSSHWKNASARMPNLSRLHRQAVSSFAQGDLDKAERLCAGILEYRQDDFDALQILGLLNLQRRRPRSNQDRPILSTRLVIRRRSLFLKLLWTP